MPLFTLVIQLSKSVEKNFPLQAVTKWNFEQNSCHKQTKLLSGKTTLYLPLTSFT